MNFKKLAAWLTLSATAATPLAIAQNPTILQGSYISNVFGNSNFVLNPNAQTNVANVTTVTATVTRSTTTPLVATSEFNVAIGTANGTATWATRAFDAGMKGQNCEARFSYRGFAATSKVHIKQGANTVASLNLTPATDPRIASINFPCGDLSTSTTFQVTDTAILAGTNEIGGIYVGLATNMANVAQAEAVGSLTWPNTSANSQVINQTSFTVFPALGTTPTATGNVTASGTAPKVTIPNMKPGSYQIIFAGNTFCFSALVDITCAYRITDGTSAFGNEIGQRSIGYVTGGSIQGQTQTSLIFSFDYSGPVTSKTFQLEAKQSTANGESRVETSAPYGNYKVSVYRFPSSSELVVTPERQNTWAGVVYNSQTQSLFAGSAEPTAQLPYTNATWNQPTLLKGKAAVTTTNSGNDLGFSIPNLPVGSYKLDVTGLLNASVGAGATTGTSTICNFKLVETTTSTEVARQNHQDQQYGATLGNETRNYVNAFTGIFTNTSLATRNFRLEAQKHHDTTTGNIGNCQAFSATGAGNNSNIAIIMTPLDQPSNSALYVEGPVKAAATGAAIPAGYVGELKQAILSTGCPGAGYNDGASITITPGVWRVTGTYTFEGNTFNDLLVFISPQSGAVSTWRQSYYNDVWNSLPQITSASKLSLTTPPLLVRYDGTTLYRFQNNTWTQAYASATGQLWTKFYYSANCSGTYTSIIAERIN